jgi:hypothetical protein
MAFARRRPYTCITMRSGRPPLPCGPLACALVRALACALAFAGAGCGGDGSAADQGTASYPASAMVSTATAAGALTVAVRTAPDQPPARGISSWELTVTDASGKPVDGLTVGAVPWMPAHGHGSSVEPTVTARGGGVYDVENVVLFMPGRWELRTTFAGPVSDSLTVDVDVP